MSAWAVSGERSLCTVSAYKPLVLTQERAIRKTRIALQFARKYQNSAEMSVFWIYAYNAERMREAFEDIAKQVKIPGYQDQGVDKLQLVKEWWESEASGKWLIVIDNVDDSGLLYPSDPQQIRYADYLPKSVAGSILLTTRNGKVGHDFAAAYNNLVLAVMNVEESISLLLARLGPDASDESLKNLAEQLDRVPLALVQASSFIIQNQVSVDRYLQLYQHSDSAKIRLLSENFEDEVRDPLSKNPIATTWAISFEYIQKHDPQAAYLLSFMAMLANQGVPEFLLPPGADPMDFEKALSTLQVFSFISMRLQPLAGSQHRFFDFHRLVRVAMRNWLNSERAFDRTTAAAIERLADVDRNQDIGKNYEFEAQFTLHAVELLANNKLQGTRGPDDLPAIFRTRKRKSRLMLLHRKPKTGCTHNGSVCPICTQSILYSITQYLIDASNTASAKHFAQRSFAMCVHLFGDSHENTIASLCELVWVHWLLQDYETAEILCRKLIKTIGPRSGPASEFYLFGMRRLVLALRDNGKIVEADAAETQLLEICQRELDETHSSINLERLVTLGEVLYFKDDFDAAANFLLRAVEDFKVRTESQPWNQSHALFLLAFSYFHLSRYHEAERYGRLAVDSNREFYGASHPLIIRSMLLLTLILRWRSKSAEADGLAESALSLSLQVNGENSPVYLEHLSVHRNFLRGYELNDKPYWK